MDLRKLKDLLLDFYPESEIESAQKYYIPTQCQNVAPILENDKNNPYAFITKQPLIPFFTQKTFDNNTDNLYIILAEAGMGKTTFIINLYFEYAQSLSNVPLKVKLLPDFLTDEELDEMEENSEVKIPAMPDKIRLFPLGFPNILEAIAKIPASEKSSTILLLDAFDEDNDALIDYKRKLYEILSTVKGFKEVIMTCRTQFFPPEEEEPKDEAGVLRFKYKNQEYTFNKLYISPFDDRDITRYINKNYSFFSFLKRMKAERIVRKSPSLMVRPMLLSHIDDLMKNKDRYLFTFQIYEELIKRWVEREVKRKSKNKESYRYELNRFSRAVAIDMYKHMKERDGLIIHEDNIKPLAESWGISLGDIELKSRSMLTVNVKNQYRFAHKSIMEYFIALEAFQNEEFLAVLNAEGFELIPKFLDDMYFEYSKLLDGFYKTRKGDKNLYELKQKEMHEIDHVILTRIKREDVQALRGFRNLKTLEIGSLKFEGEILRDFLFLSKLDFSNMKLFDIQVLADIVHLQHLDLSNNSIVNLQPLKKLKSLKTLYLQNNKITDITILSELKKLETLDLSNNIVADIYPLMVLDKLKNLDLSNNQVGDISPLKNLKKLKKLGLNRNPIPQPQLADLKQMIDF